MYQGNIHRYGDCEDLYECVKYTTIQHLCFILVYTQCAALIQLRKIFFNNILYLDTSIRSNLDAVLNHLQHLHIPVIILAVGPRFPQKIELLIEDLQKIGIISLFLQNGDKTKVVVDDSAEIPAIPVD